MAKLFHPTPCSGCDYFSMLGFKLKHVNKGAHGHCAVFCFSVIWQWSLRHIATPSWLSTNPNPQPPPLCQQRNPDEYGENDRTEAQSGHQGITAKQNTTDLYVYATRHDVEHSTLWDMMFNSLRYETWCLTVYAMKHDVEQSMLWDMMFNSLRYETGCSTVYAMRHDV